MDQSAELEDFEKAEPYLRAAAAFLIYLVRGTRPHEDGEMTIDRCFDTANQFILKLKGDVSAS